MTRFFRGNYRSESRRLKGFDYSSPGSYFVTICTRWMIDWFGDVVDGLMKLSEVGEIVADEWQKTSIIRPTVTLDEWQTMPNHFHGILMIHESESAARSGRIPFVDWDRAMTVPGGGGKSVATTRLVVATGSSPDPRRVVGTLKPNSLGSIIGQIKSACTTRIHDAGHRDFQWQGRFWDRIIRDQDELDRIRTYIRENPRNWNPARRPSRQSRLRAWGTENCGAAGFTKRTNPNTQSTPDSGNQRNPQSVVNQ